jgi:hypothetical protein
MQRFEDAVIDVVGPRVSPADLQFALRAVGPRAQQPVAQLSRVVRAQLADHFVRNLKSLSVNQATELEHELMARLDATPTGVFTSKLDGAVALVEVRSHLKQTLTGLGLDWERITRAQSLIAGVARWLQTIGNATMQVLSTENSVHFVLTAQDRHLTPDLVRRSPLVKMLSEHSTGFDVNKADVTVEITFSIQRP